MEVQMTTIEQHCDCATLINVFTVEPGRAAELVALLDAATDEVMRHQPGFKSANIHLSTDGTRVVNYAQWESVASYQAMLAHREAQPHMAQAAAIAVTFDPHLYTVESVHER
jgi:heme-degrading monooxygenase HmoA